MLRATAARLSASAKLPTSPNAAAASAASNSSSKQTSHGTLTRPHIHNPLYKKQASLSLARSRPLAVRLRRAQRYAQETGRTPSTDKKPVRRLGLDTFLKRDEERTKNIPIPRIRGMTVAYHKGKPYTVKVEGQKVYLPNIVFRLVRNYTAPGEPYNPWQATFRIPKNLTKTDVRSYLMAVYGVQTTYIRTDNYYAELSRRPNRLSSPDKNPSLSTYKRAIVGLVEPFYYPLRMEDMTAERREQREAELEEKLMIQVTKDMEIVTRQNSLLMQHMPKKQHRSTYWTRDVKPTRAKRIRSAAEQRHRRQDLVSEQVQAWQQQRAKDRDST